MDLRFPFVQPNEPFILQPLLGAETSAAKDENHWMLSLLAVRRASGVSSCGREAHSLGRSTLEPCRIAFEVLNSFMRVADQAASRHKSMAMSPSGCEQQISTLPSAGASTGWGR